MAIVLYQKKDFVYKILELERGNEQQEGEEIVVSEESMIFLGDKTGNKKYFQYNESERQRIK